MLNPITTAYNTIRGDYMPKEIHVVIRPAGDVGGYFALCDMPNGGCTTQGATLQETQKSMFEAIEFYLEDFPEITEYYLTFEVHYA